MLLLYLLDYETSSEEEGDREAKEEGRQQGQLVEDSLIVVQGPSLSHLWRCTATLLLLPGNSRLVLFSPESLRSPAFIRLREMLVLF